MSCVFRQPVLTSTLLLMHGEPAGMTGYISVKDNAADLIHVLAYEK